VAVKTSSSINPIATIIHPLVTGVIDGGFGIPEVLLAIVGGVTSKGVVGLTPRYANAICTDPEDNPVAVVSGVGPIIL
jgi:hypothetical protein